MNKPIVIAIDAMGGDNSPKKIIDGIELYQKSSKNIFYKLFGDKNSIEQNIKSKNINDKSYEIIHTENNIKGEDSALMAAKRGKNTSMWMSIESVKNKTSDIICALSIIHWIYSCTEVFGSLDLILKFLSKITRETLIIEWIEPEDEAINYFKHIDFNEKYVTDKYCKDLFIIALKKHFSSFESLGLVSREKPRNRNYFIILIA